MCHDGCQLQVIYAASRVVHAYTHTAGADCHAAVTTRCLVLTAGLCWYMLVISVQGTDLDCSKLLMSGVDVSVELCELQSVL